MTARRRPSSAPVVRAVVRAGIVLGALLGVAACAIEPDAQPRAVPEEQRGQFGAQATGDVAAGTARIFLLAPSAEQEAKLRSVLRDVPNDPEDIISSLLAGANASEQDNGLFSVLPDDLELLNTRVRGRVLTVDLSDSFNELTPDALRFAVAQIVSTANEIDGVENVRLQINGENQVWPRGDGENTDRVLTIYDYPGFVESSQPAYPAIPTANS